MTFIKFIFFCIYFHKYTGKWPLISQKKMFFSAESKAKVSSKEFARNQGVTTFLGVYSSWKSEHNPFVSIFYVTNPYGVEKFLEFNLPKGNNLIIVDASKLGWQDRIRGLCPTLLLIDNEVPELEVLIPLFRASDKTVFFFNF